MTDLTPEELEELKRCRARVLGKISTVTTDPDALAYIVAFNAITPALIRAAEENGRLKSDLEAERDGAAILAGYLRDSDAENAQLRASILELQDLVTASEERANAQGCELTQVRARLAKAEVVVEAAQEVLRHIEGISDNGTELKWPKLSHALAAYSKET